MEYNDIRRLVKLVEGSDIEELKIEEKEFKIRITKAQPKVEAAAPIHIPVPTAAPAAIPHQKVSSLSSIGEQSAVRPIRISGLPLFTGFLPPRSPCWVPRQSGVTAGQHYLVMSPRPAVWRSFSVGISCRE